MTTTAWQPYNYSKDCMLQLQHVLIKCIITKVQTQQRTEQH